MFFEPTRDSYWCQKYSLQELYLSIVLACCWILEPLLSFFIVTLYQAPRPLSQADLQRVLATSTKTGVAANEYSRSSSQSPGWPRQSDDYQVQATINELSKLMVSQILNLQPPDNQDTWNIHLSCLEQSGFLKLSGEEKLYLNLF